VLVLSAVVMVASERFLVRYAFPFLFCLAKFCTLGVVGGVFFLLPVAAGDDEVKCQHIGDQLVLG
jgi:hypothetical protein